MSDTFNTKNEFAKKYDLWRRKEELQKLKDKYGDDLEAQVSSSSDSDSDSEDDPTLTDPKLQEDWLKTLTALKTKDPRIYQKDYRFFEDPNEEASSDDSDSENESKSKKRKKEKPMYLKDYKRKVILEKGGIISSDDEDFDPAQKSGDVVTYHEEQEEIRKSFVKAAENLVDDDDDNDDEVGGGLLLKRKRTLHEEEIEKQELTDWKNKEEESKKKKKRRDFGIEAEPINTWDIPNLDEKERFLKNFILGQAYKEKDSKRIPTYDEVVYGDEDEETFKEEGEFLDKAEKFEKRHNFRFEEYGGSEVKSYPREIDNLVRRKDTKRAEQRNAIKERKRLEKEKKKEELKRLKNLKRQEIQSKIEKLKAITGNESLGFNEDELEEDFDPNKHDEMMQKCFDDEYYAVGTDEVQKPVFEMSDDEENWDNWTGGAGTSGNHGNQEEGPHADDPDFCMDADYDPSMKRESRKKMKRKKNKNKKKLGEALEQSKPVFDPNEKTFEEYIDEYYNLDFEDIIDDIPCRFKYRKVTPNSFGLSTDEILKCHDKELNAWVSVKKLSQYRNDDEEQYDIRAFNMKAKNENTKKRILYSLYEREEDKQRKSEETANQEGEASTSKKRRKKRKGKKRDKSLNGMGYKNNESGSMSVNDKSEIEDKDNKLESLQTDTFKDSNVGAEEETTSLSEEKKKKKKKKKQRQENEESERGESKVADGDSLQLKGEHIVDSAPLSQTDKSSEEFVSKKKDKKKKKKDAAIMNGPPTKMNVSNSRLRAYGINPKKFKSSSQDNFQYKHGKI